MRILLPLTALAATALLSACGSSPGTKSAPPPPPMATVSTATMAEANLAPASASLVSGRLALVPEAGGVHITGVIGGLPRGQQAVFHLH